MGVYKTDFKFSTVCEKMSENRRSRGGGIFIFVFDSHCIYSQSELDTRYLSTLSYDI